MMGMFMAASVVNKFVLNISANSVNPDIRALCVAGGWNQFSGVLVNVTAARVNRIALGSSSFPGGIEIYLSPSTWLGTDGAAALSTSVPVTMDNRGTIAGVGGSGGRGETFYYSSSPVQYVDGGLGGSGQMFASNSTTILSASIGQPGESVNFDGVHTAIGGRGGTGGSWGDGGGTGLLGADNSGGIINGSFPPTAGSAGGLAVSGNSYITWKSTGTRLGGIV